jgi:hypothetical protein
VKEKFDELRVYIDDATPEMKSRIDDGEVERTGNKRGPLHRGAAVRAMRRPAQGLPTALLVLLSGPQVKQWRENHGHIADCENKGQRCEHLDVAYVTAQRAVDAVVEAGLLREATGNRRNRKFHFEPYITLFGSP